MSTLDALPAMPRNPDVPVRIPVIDRYKEMGLLHVVGKVEVGTLTRGDTLALVPSQSTAEVVGIVVDESEVDVAMPGENVRVKLKGIEEDDVHGGMVLCDAANPCKVSVPSRPSLESGVDAKLRQTAQLFEAKMVVSELLSHKPLITAGYQAILHLHSLICECEIEKLLQEFSKKNKPSKRPPTFVRTGAIITCRIKVDLAVPVEVLSFSVSSCISSLTFVICRHTKTCRSSADLLYVTRARLLLSGK